MNERKPPSRLRMFLDSLLAGASMTAGLGDRPRRVSGTPARRKKLKGWQRENRRRKNRWA